MTRLRSVLLVVLVGLLGYGIGILQPYVLRPELAVGQDAAVADAGPVTTRLPRRAGRVLVVEPAQTEPTSPSFSTPEPSSDRRPTSGSGTRWRRGASAR